MAMAQPRGEETPAGRTGGLTHPTSVLLGPGHTLPTWWDHLVALGKIQLSQVSWMETRELRWPPA